MRMQEGNTETNHTEMQEGISAQEIARLLQQIREKRPLVHMLPNSVSAAFCGDALAALGARPLMALCPGEMEELAAYADALVVNLGQPGEEKQEAARRALRAAGERGLPVVLDPVGAGASAYRLQNLEELLAISWKGIVKGNEAENVALFSGRLTHEGVDSVRSHDFLEADPERVRALSRAGERVFVSTGRENRIFTVEERRLILLGCMCHRAAPAYGLIGTGCMTGALMGAFCGAAEEVPEAFCGAAEEAPEGFCKAAEEITEVFGGRAEAVRPDIWSKYSAAVWAALLTVGFVQEQAGTARGYGSFRQEILDGLSRFTGEEEAFLSYLKEHAFP
ncbi:MAG: hypothetical protein HFI30_13115 [Lachnospiraceae bacterium]|jgi:hydroxyethylthiazole kinase|nr:hypothetical protein [Lachnospiraceae bacterium]